MKWSMKWKRERCEGWEFASWLLKLSLIRMNPGTIGVHRCVPEIVENFVRISRWENIRRITVYIYYKYTIYTVCVYRTAWNANTTVNIRHRRWRRCITCNEDAFNIHTAQSEKLFYTLHISLTYFSAHRHTHTHIVIMLFT